jgi:hypothetical protein
VVHMAVLCNIRVMTSSVPTTSCRWRPASVRGRNFIRVHPCSSVFTHVHPFSPMFIRVHSCSSVFTRVHPCSPAFTRVHPCSSAFTHVLFCSHVLDIRPVWKRSAVVVLCLCSVNQMFVSTVAADTFGLLTASEPVSRQQLRGSGFDSQHYQIF